MPVILDDIVKDFVASTTTQKAPVFTPKFFHKTLTGKGGRAGVLNDTVHPANSESCNYDTQVLKHKHYASVNNSPDVRYIPVGTVFNPVYEEIVEGAYKLSVERIDHAGGVHHVPDTDAYPLFFRTHVPDTSTLFDVSANIPVNFDDDYHIFVRITPQHIVLKSQKSVHDDGSSSTDNTTFVYYRTEMFCFHENDITTTVDADGNDVYEYPETVPTITDVSYHYPNIGYKSFCVINHDWEPFNVVQDNLFEFQDICDHTNAYHSAVIDCDAFENWSKNHYSNYDEISHLAQAFNNDIIADQVNHLIDTVVACETVKKNNTALKNSSMDTISIVNQLGKQLSYMEHFPVPLETYSSIYTHVTAFDAIDKNATKYLLKRNLQLNLNSHLSDLSTIKDQLPVPSQSGVSAYTPDPKFSTQQLKAITTNEPLVLTQAGAGTGKTTVIMERIKYLESCDVPLDQVKVISFTNAAANNVTERNPQVNSQTIATSYLEQYSHNFPTHRISTLDTIMRSLVIHFKSTMNTDETLSRFYHLINAARAQDNPSMTALNNFVEEHCIQVIQILNTIQQTSLELALIISYQLLEDLTYVGTPPKFLIIDEVQDNSIFEFMYALKFAAHHKCSFYIVGDSSQTLYEFRAANPKALNTLESSGIFATYQLTTNYRSNQEILDFANVVLGDIEANQFAKIKLEANDLRVPTYDTFADSVQLMHLPGVKKQSFVENIPDIFALHALNSYIESKLAAGERVCVLAATRRTVSKAQSVLAQRFPQHKVANLTSDLTYNTVVFSKFIEKYWDVVESVPVDKMAYTIHSEVMNNLSRMEKNASKIQDKVVKMLTRWFSEISGQYSSWVQMYNLTVNKPNVTTAEIDAAKNTVLDRLRDSLLNFEIRHNAINRSLKSKTNEQRKQMQNNDNYKLIVSTIHGVKGLEFDNVVLLQAPTDTLSEDQKRTLYVALTRAQKSEFLVIASNHTIPRLVTEHENMLLALEQRDMANQIVASNPYVATALDGDVDKIASIDFEKIARKVCENSDHLIDSETAADCFVFYDDDGEPIGPDLCGYDTFEELTFAMIAAENYLDDTDTIVDGYEFFDDNLDDADDTAAATITNTLNTVPPVHTDKEVSSTTDDMSTSNFWDIVNRA